MRPAILAIINVYFGFFSSLSMKISEGTTAVIDDVTDSFAVWFAVTED